MTSRIGQASSSLLRRVNRTGLVSIDRLGLAPSPSPSARTVGGACSNVLRESNPARSPMTARSDRARLTLVPRGNPTRFLLDARLGRAPSTLLRLSTPPTWGEARRPPRPHLQRSIGRYDRRRRSRCRCPSRLRRSCRRRRKRSRPASGAWSGGATTSDARCRVAARSAGSRSTMSSRRPEAGPRSVSNALAVFRAPRSRPLGPPSHRRHRARSARLHSCEWGAPGPAGSRARWRRLRHRLRSRSRRSASDGSGCR